MRLGLALFVLLSPLLSTAQLAGEDFMPEIGARYVLHHCAPMEPGADGQRVTWDFSNIQIESSNGIRVIEAAESRYASDFPAADICYDLGQGDQLFARHNGSTFTRMGGVADGVVLSFRDGQDLLHFPVEYGESYSDSFESEFEAKGVSFERSGRIDISVTGEGTVILPEAVVDGVYKIRVTETITDRYRVLNQPMSQVTKNVSYLYVRAGLDDVLVTLTSSKKEDSEEARAYSMYIDSDKIDAIKDGDAPLREWTITERQEGNLAIRFVSEWEGELELSVTDVYGNVVLSAPKSAIEAGVYETQLSIGQLKTGTYLMRLTLDGRSSQRVMMVEK